MKMLKTLCLITLISIAFILVSCGNSNSFSKRKYRKGVFIEYSVNNTSSVKNSRKKDRRNSVQIDSNEMKNFGDASFEGFTFTYPPDSNKIRYAVFRQKLNEKPNRLAKRRFHKKWLKDSLMKFDRFKALKKSDQRALITEQYKIERTKEIRDLKAIRKAIEDSIHPGQTRREYKDEQIQILKQGLHLAKTKRTRKSTAIGMSTFPVFGASLIGSLFILGFEAYLVFIGVGLALFTMFTINLVAYKKNKKEFQQIKNPDKYTQHVYRKSRRMNVLGMFLSIGAMIVITLFFLFYWLVTNS